MWPGFQIQDCHYPYQGAGTSYISPNLFIYQARESSLVAVGFLTAQFLQKL